jgi:hypothetical protein
LIPTGRAAPYLAGADDTMADTINFPWIRNPERRNISAAVR